MGYKKLIYIAKLVILSLTPNLLDTLARGNGGLMIPEIPALIVLPTERHSLSL